MEKTPSSRSLAELPRSRNPRKTGIEQLKVGWLIAREGSRFAYAAKSDDFYLCATLHGSLCPFEEASGNLSER